MEGAQERQAVEQYLKLYAPVLAFSLFAFMFIKDKKKWEFADDEWEDEDVLSF